MNDNDMEKMNDRMLEKWKKTKSEYEKAYEALEKENEALKIKVIRAEAIREFAERLKEKTFDIVLYGEIVTVSMIDRIVKEMVGERE